MRQNEFYGVNEYLLTAGKTIDLNLFSLLLTAKRRAALYLKNWVGKTTRKRIVVFSFDDYGNVFLHSRAARESMRKAGLNVDISRFSQFDALETTTDLAELFDTLSSYKDINGNHPVITAFALPANLDFDKIASSGRFAYHLLPETFKSIPGYEGTWALWLEGISKGLIYPQFHGREHLNVRLFEKLLDENSELLKLNLETRSYSCIRPDFPTRVGFTEAFSFDDKAELNDHKIIISDGFRVFKEVFGFEPKHFNAPGAREHIDLASHIASEGATILDTDIYRKDYEGAGAYKRSVIPFGSKNAYGQTLVIRNCVFEPLLSEQAVDTCLAEMEIAFTCGKPANISSHRVNFGGHIEPWVREKGLAALNELLSRMLKKWPDIEFMTTEAMAAQLEGG